MALDQPILLGDVAAARIVRRFSLFLILKDFCRFLTYFAQLYLLHWEFRNCPKAIRGSPWVAMVEKTCSEEYAQRIKHRFRMVSMLEGLLLHVHCDDLRVRSGLDEDEQKEDGFLYSFTLDRPW